MMDVDVNFWAILVTGIASMVIGFVWYSKPVFGKAWMEAIGKTEDQLKKEAKPAMYVWALILALIEAWILAIVIGVWDAITLWEGVQIGFWMWVGFVLTTHSVNAMFDMAPMKKVWISLGYHLVYLIVGGAILAVWI